MKKPDQSMNGRILSVTWPHAKTDYECYGCAGECPVPAGEWYMRVNVLWQGSVHSYHYCQRCACALDSRTKHTNKPGVTVDGRGALRWNKLSNAFKKSWTDFAKNIRACKTEEEENMVEAMFFKEIRGE